MDRVTLRRLDDGVVLAAGMIVAFRLGLSETCSGALWLMLGLGICSGSLFLSWRELRIVPPAIALGAAVVVTAGRQSHPPSDDLPWVAAWVLTIHQPGWTRPTGRPARYCPAFAPRCTG